MTIDGGLRALFRRHITSAQWTTIETGMTAQGVPDAEFCFPPVPLSQCKGSAVDYSHLSTTKPGVQGWIEYKTTSGWAVTLRPEQIGWLDRRQRLGGRAFVAVRRVANRGAKVDELWLYKLTTLVTPQALRTGGLRGVEPDYRGADGPQNWDWKKIEAILRGTI